MDLAAKAIAAVDSVNAESGAAFWYSVGRYFRCPDEHCGCLEERMKFSKKEFTTIVSIGNDREGCRQGLKEAIPAKGMALVADLPSDILSPKRLSLLSRAVLRSKRFTLSSVAWVSLRK